MEWQTVARVWASFAQNCKQIPAFQLWLDSVPVAARADPQQLIALLNSQGPFFCSIDVYFYSFVSTD
jgi:hypothetical protein